MPMNSALACAIHFKQKFHDRPYLAAHWAAFFIGRIMERLRAYLKDGATGANSTTWLTGSRGEKKRKKNEKKGLADFSVSPLILCGALEQD